MKKVGIITFHNSYNCGSMLEAYAIQKYLLKRGINNEIVNFSSDGQKELYSVYFKNNNLKNVIKNIIIFFHRNKIKNNNLNYEEFKNKNFILSKEYSTGDIISEDNYSVVVAGSDQIWNITIKDSDDSYFLNWVNNARKVAYAPSFGAKKITDYTNDSKYTDFLNNFDALSIRENNGKMWIKEMIGKDVPVLIDPTLLLDAIDYDEIIDNNYVPNFKYIFFYSPHFNNEMCKFVKKISEKYKLPVITWSAKRYYTKFIRRYGFKLANYESPSSYLSLIKNAEMIFTTSFHGSIFSTIYRKKFFTVKNGEMYGNDDRVITLLDSIGMEERLIEPNFDDKFDYFKNVNYKIYENKLNALRKEATDYLERNVVEYYNEDRK